MPKSNKPSDFNQFAVTVFSASVTVMDFEQYYEYYYDLLRLLYWNPDVDTPLFLSQDSNPSGVVLKGDFHG
ncbi:hypothetical protein [Methylobacter tundripaludum]|uniref:hypothetical protein n=1 Tax=Methylobacter tundripaludum TaxID=173365 RepID=UPI000B33F803|nr:hypothetical protein [Methylobacter tundripaludum]